MQKPQPRQGIVAAQLAACAQRLALTNGYLSNNYLPSLHVAPSWRTSVQVALPLHVRVAHTSLAHVTAAPAHAPDLHESA